MSDEGRELATFVRHRMQELGLSYEAAARRSGGLVSHGTLHRLGTGRHRGGLRPDTLRGVAFALDVDEDSLVRLVPERSIAVRPFVLPPRAHALDAAERRLVLDLIDRLLARRQTGPASRVAPASTQ